MEKIAFGAAEGRRSVGEVLLPIVESQGVDAALERKEDAIRTLRKALGQDPWMASAVETLRRLEGHAGVATLGSPGGLSPDPSSESL